MQKVFGYISRHQMIQANDKVIVGVSGGADSICLLFILREYADEVPFSMLAVHVEHGIRGEESLQDACFVEKLCAKLQVGCRVVSCDVPAFAKKEGLSLEEAARTLRYRAFAEVQKETGAQKIAVAHNQDDQAETILFQVSRGSGLSGAGGMHPVRGNIIRPLLCLSRAEIENYLREREVTWRTDSTNQSAAFSRNYIRHQIMPLLKKEINSAADVHLAALGEELREVQAYMQRQAEQAAAGIFAYAAGWTELDVDGFLEQEKIIQEYILRICLHRAGCGLKDITRRHMESIRALFAGQSGKEISLPHGWRAARQFDRVRIFHAAGSLCAESAGECPKQQPLRVSGTGEELVLQKSRIPGEYRVGGCTFIFQSFPNENQNILKKTYTKWLDYDKINNSFMVRTRRPGDYIVINREGGKKKLKAYLIEEKIPASRRDNVLLLASGSEILWVVGHRLSEAYKVTDGTKRILEVQMTGGNFDGEDISNDSGGRSEPQD